ncbi:hypothetical protein GCM10012284_28680 [Mangrovihabitans endophyticus]|uniref:Uncharacterized protein n=1 Tax=Mangrovihabitans endophyticus TaxID=1751298 RepID=A0A8J3C0R9_9ACTN|nr:hypothetical protein GCM10012284_28680 [Mangrovihabitans endophyticus]
MRLLLIHETSDAGDPDAEDLTTVDPEHCRKSGAKTCGNPWPGSRKRGNLLMSACLSADTQSRAAPRAVALRTRPSDNSAPKVELVGVCGSSSRCRPVTVDAHPGAGGAPSGNAKGGNPPGSRLRDQSRQIT